MWKDAADEGIKLTAAANISMVTLGRTIPQLMNGMTVVPENREESILRLAAADTSASMYKNQVVLTQKEAASAMRVIQAHRDLIRAIETCQHGEGCGHPANHTGPELAHSVATLFAWDNNDG